MVNEQAGRVPTKVVNQRAKVVIEEVVIVFLLYIEKTFNYHFAITTLMSFFLYII